MNESVHECRAIIAQHSKSFSLAAKLLPAGCRDAAMIVYAWCRRADDAVDLAEANGAETALARLREELVSIYAGSFQEDPILRGFQHIVQERRIPLEYPSELLAGMEMDVVPQNYATLDDLLLYCHRVAGVVGLMMCHVLGIADDRALLHAAHMGIAMQLTNICRDVDEDRRRGRCYLPGEMLSRSAKDGLASGNGGEMSQKMRRDLAGPIRRILELADLYYRSGDQGVPYLGRRSAFAIRTARLVYSAIGRQIARSGYDAGCGRAYVSHVEKIGLMVRALGQTLISVPARSSDFNVLGPPKTLLEYPESVELDQSLVWAGR